MSDRTTITSEDAEYEAMVALAEATTFDDYRKTIIYQERLWRVYRDQGQYRFCLMEETNKRMRQLSKFYTGSGLP